MKPLLLVFSVCALAAQQGSVGGPSLGMVFDSQARAFRTVLGIPGSATLGEPWKPDVEVAGAAVSPSGDYALATTVEGKLAVVRTGRPAAVLETAPGRIVFSPSGRSAAVIRGEDVAIVTGLPGNPEAAWSISVQAVEAAVADDGTVAAYLDGSGVSAIDRSGSVRNLPAGDAFAFSPGTHDLVIAAREARSVILVRDAAGAAESSVIAAESDGVREPSSVAVAQGKALVANGNGEVLLLPLEGGAAVTVQCDCTLGSLQGLNDTVVRLTNQGETLRIFDLASGRVLFVPAGGVE